MKRITRCRACEDTNIKEFLDLGKQPYANSLLKNPTEKEKFYPLSLSWCSQCSLVQLNHTADPKELFSNYIWVTSTSSTTRKYAKAFCENTLSRIEKPTEGYILELASNDGTFLLPFKKKGCKVLGVDPAKNIVDLAVKNGIPTKCEFFGVSSARRIIKDFGPAKVIVARNVLPHIANLHDFIKGICISLDDKGLLVLEVHYAKKIYQELHYDSIYHEHLCYFTIKSLESILNLYNLYIEDIKTSPISGGSLVLYIKRGKIKESQVVKTYRRAEKKTKLNTFRRWSDFANRVKKHRKKLLEILNKQQDEIIVGYGASARSSTLLNFCKIGTNYLSVIADQNPLKQGFYTAGTHILIENPDIVMKKRPSVIIILGWNFKDEIIKILREKYNYQSICILPLPNNPKIVKIEELDDNKRKQNQKSL